MYLAKLGGREDLNYLFTEMLGEVTIGHMFIFGGDVPKPRQVKGGLLGADYKVEKDAIALPASTTAKTGIRICVHL